MIVAATLLLAAVITTSAYLLHRFYGTEHLYMSGDGRRYLAMGIGSKVEAPFCRRLFLPMLLGGKPRRWYYTNAIILIAIGPLLTCWLLLSGATPLQTIYGVVLFIGLIGAFKLGIDEPVMVDSAAHAVTLLLCIGVAAGVPIWLLVTGSLLASSIKESTPIFAAAISGQPWLLVGLAGYGIICYWRLRDSGARRGIAHDFRYIRTRRGWRFFDPPSMLGAWGVALPLALLHPSALLWIGLAIAYGQLFLATDTLRLSQYAFPVVILAAVTTPFIWPALWGLLLVLHLFNPWGVRTWAIKDQFQLEV